LDYLNLVSKFDGKTIKLVVSAEPMSSAIRKLPMIHHVIIDTGADTTAFTKEFLKRRGYGKYQKSNLKKSTATGEVELLTCEINGLTIANQFSFGKMTVDVLENWKARTVVGVIGMDILSRMTFILSHEHKKLMLTNRHVPELEELFS
jgi:predicted aspartyl protease